MSVPTSPYQRAIAVEELKFGMYVAQLDRPWVETHFLFQGFKLSRKEDLQELRQLCHYVIIDIERGDAARHYLDDLHPARARDALEQILERRGNCQAYTDQTTLDDEIGPARRIHEDLNQLMLTIMDDVRAGRELKVKTIRGAISNMVDSILRNPDAFSWLSRLKDKDAYSYAHSIDTCSLAVSFGRHLSLPRQELEHLAIGILLCDIGKVHIPTELLSKPGRLTDKEFSLIQQHVAFSVREMQEIPGISQDSIAATQHHHERHNGSGYPNRLTGTNIPLYGRIAALVDCYDAITSDRPYAAAITQHEAINKLYQWRNVDFQEAVVEQFIQCIGIYPTGSLVELSSGEVGVILAQNRVRRLRPKVMLILDRDKVAYDFSPVKDLMTDTEDEQGYPLEITQPLQPGAYGIEPRDYYL